MQTIVLALLQIILADVTPVLKQAALDELKALEPKLANPFIRLAIKEAEMILGGGGGATA